MNIFEKTNAIARKNGTGLKMVPVIFKISPKFLQVSVSVAALITSSEDAVF
jgi:hypothetical protein